MNIWDKIKSFFKKLLRKFKAFMNVAFPIASRVIIAELQDFAIEVVSGLELSDLRGPQKRERAFAELKAEAISRGKNASTSLLYSIVEIAKQYIENR